MHREKKIRPLMIEDNPAEASLMEEMLVDGERTLFSVEHVDRLSPGLERLTEEEFDVVLLDLGLPDSKGLETFISLHNQVPQVPIIVLSGLDDEKIAVEAVRMGAQDYLVKGKVDGELLARAIRYAIERQRAENALAQHAAQLELLNDIGREISGLMNVDELLEKAVRLVYDNFGYHSITVLMVDDEGGEPNGLEIKAIAGAYRDLFLAQQQIELGRGMVGWVAEHGEKLLANDVTLEPRYVNPHPDEIATRSELSVPILIGERVVGVLDVQSPRLNAFDESDVKVMEILVGQIAVAIENARLYDDIKANHDYYRAVVNGLHDEVLVIDRDYRITDVNDTLLRRTGGSREEIVGRRCHTLFTEPTEACDPEGALCPAQKVWSTGHAVRATVPHVGEEGITRWFDIAASPLYGEDDQITHVVEAYRDVTAERRLEERLSGIHLLGRELVLSRDQRQIAQVAVDAAMLLSQSPMCDLWLIDEEEGILTNWGHTEGAYVVELDTLSMDNGESVVVQAARSREAIYIPDVEEASDRADAGAESRSQLCTPLKVKEKILGVMHIESASRDAFDEVDRQLLAVLADYTALALENTRLYDETAQRLAETRTLQEVVLAAASTLDFDEALTQALQAIHQTLGVEYLSFVLPNESGEYLLVHPSFILPAPPPDEDRRIPLEDSVTGRAYTTGEPVLIPNVTEVSYYFEYTSGVRSELAVPIEVGDHIVGVLDAKASYVDAFDDDDLRLFEAIAVQLGIVMENARLYEAEREQRKLLEQSRSQLVQSEKLAATGRLAASLAHEINNPLQAIHNSLQIMLSFPVEPEEQQEYLKMADEDVERLTNIVERMLNFARRPEQKMKPTDVNDIVKKTLALTGKYLQHSHVTLQQDLSPDLPPVMAIPGELRQVFLNLVLNAVDAMPEGGTLRVSSRLADDGRLTVAFTDTGRGIPQKHRDRIFEPFFSTKEEGTGLGLSISYNVAKRHGGDITIKSTVGEGTTFTVWLPTSTVH